MKKLLVMVLMLSMVMLFSGVISANGHVDGWEKDEGIFANWTKSMFGPYIAAQSNSSWNNVIVDGLGISVNRDRLAEMYPGDQSGKITVPAEAYIPCYIEMTITGNLGRTKIKSLGDDAHIEAPFGENNFLAFIPDQTGLMNDQWQYVDFNSWAFSTLPGTAYIGACDMLKLEVYGNTPYKVDIDAEGFRLDGAGDEVFFLETRIFSDLGDTIPEFDTMILGSFTTGQLVPLEEYEWFFQFRVPMYEGEAGKYTTEIVFMITTEI